VNAAVKDGPRQHDDDEVIDREVGGATDDPLRRALGDPLTVLAHVNLAPADRLAVLLPLFDELKDATHDKRAGDVATVQVLLLQTQTNQAGCHLATGRDGCTLDILMQP
jgi:hypothetical protein